MKGARCHRDVSRGVEAVSVEIDKDVQLADVTDFVYVRHNIPGQGVSSESFEHIFKGCDCAGKTSCDDSCVCISRFGKMYGEFTQLIGVNPYSQKMQPIYECNRSCKCSKACHNRVVQNGVNIELSVFKTAEKGVGVRSLDDIGKNTFVCEYAGEVVSLEVARSRTKNLRENEPNYILTLLEHGADDPIRTYVDPTYIGNVGRFINHSCQPNLYMVPVRVDHDIPHLALFALMDITADEELSFDYSGVIQILDTKTNDVTAILDNDKSAEGTTCHCGSAHCRGILPFDEVLFTE